MKRVVTGITLCLCIAGVLFSQQELNGSDNNIPEQDTAFWFQRGSFVLRGNITAGLNISDLVIHAQTPYAEADLERGPGFQVGVGVEWFFFSRLSANLKVMWSAYNAALSDYEIPDTALRKDDVVLNFSYIDLPAELKFYITRDRFTPYLFAGLRYGVLVEQDIAAQSTLPSKSATYTLELDKLKRGYAGGAGFSLPLAGGSEIQVELGYASQSGYNGNQKVLSLESYFFHLCYLF